MPLPARVRAAVALAADRDRGAEAVAVVRLSLVLLERLAAVVFDEFRVVARLASALRYGTGLA